MNSPCETCTRRKRPSECGNIYCEDWRGWFKKAWDDACAMVRAALPEETEDETKNKTNAAGSISDPV